MSLWRSVLGLIAMSGLSWDDLKPAGGVPTHDHPFAMPDTPTLVQLSEALGGGIYPGLGSGQNDTMPNQDSVAPSFPLNLFYVEPANSVKRQAVKLTFQPSPYRTPVGAATGAGTNHGHGGDTVSSLAITINNNSPHQHRMFLYQSNPGSDGGSTWQKFIMEDSTGGINHQEQVWLHTDNGITADIYTDPTGSDGTHTHTDVAHGHTPGTTGGEAAHTHSTVTGFSSGTSPDNMGVIVDGTDITSQLGGPFNATQTDVDITPYVAPGTGVHLVQVTTATQVGRIYGWIRHKGIVNNLGTLA